jgi:hypothetical protein
MSELLWVAVPSGLASSTTALLRVMVVPRLQAGTLTDVGLQDWPSLLADAGLELRTKSSEGVRVGQRAPVLRPAARLEVWQAFFGEDGGVIDDFQPRSHPTPMVSRTHREARAVVGTYRTCATELARPAAGTPKLVHDCLATWFDASPAAPPAPPPSPPIAVPPDFHRTVAHLREHPAVMVELGLIFEATVDVADLRAGDPGSPRFLSLRCSDPPLSFLVTSPWTGYELTGTGFWPAADGATMIRRGMLDLAGAVTVMPSSPSSASDAADDAVGDEPPWAVATFDVDGGVDGLRAAARGLQTPSGGERPSRPPGLRSAGLALVRPGRGGDYRQRNQAAAANALIPMAETHIAADDLVLGFRVDIRVGDDAHWRSLCERQVVYRVNGLTIGEPAAGVDDRDETAVTGHREEGHVKPFAAVKDAEGRLTSDELVVRWNGWSLVVPPPDLLQQARGSTRRADVHLPYDFYWEYTVPDGRLPRLRFGTRYQMRVRVADITGGGPKVTDASDERMATGTILYTRHDPVPPPLLLGDGSSAPGTAVDRLVIRSDHDMTVADLHAAVAGYPETERRTLLPPPAPFALVEQHGMLDPPAADELTWTWAQRALDPGTDVDAHAAGLPDPVAGGINAFVAAEPGGLTHDRSVRTNWLPWTALVDEAGRSEKESPSNSPQQTKTIVLREQTDPTEPISLQWVGDELRVRLSKAEQATIELSSTVRDGFADHLALSEWLLEEHVSLVSTLNGRHPMVTPVRRIEVVHAVKRPLLPPEWRLPPTSVMRSAGDTDALLLPAFAPDGLHTDSTARLDISATWQEWSDDGDVPVSVDHVHSEAVARGDPPRPHVRHQFGDTKHRWITYTLTGISRFRHDFRSNEPDDAFHVARQQLPVNILSSARPPAPVVASTMPAFELRTNDSTNRLDRSRLGRRLRIELERPWYSTGEGERLAVLVAPDGAAVARPDLVTQIGRDPLFAAATLPRFPPASWFAGTAPGEHAVTVRVFDQLLLAVPYAVERYEDHWFTDIEVVIPTQVRAYNPFIRLALARLQTHSLPGLSLSQLVFADLVPLLPDRRLIVERAAGLLKITLAGVQPTPPNRIDAILERCDAPTGQPPSTIDLIAVSQSQVEGVGAWRPVPGHAVQSDAAGHLPPLPLPNDAGPMRVRIRESERLEETPVHGLPPEMTQRTVYMAVTDLPDDWR